MTTLHLMMSTKWVQINNDGNEIYNQLMVGVIILTASMHSSEVASWSQNAINQKKSLCQLYYDVHDACDPAEYRWNVRDICILERFSDNSSL